MSNSHHGPLPTGPGSPSPTSLPARTEVRPDESAEVRPDKNITSITTYLLQVDGTAIEETDQLRAFREKMRPRLSNCVLEANGTEQALEALDSDSNWQSSDPNLIHNLEKEYVGLSWYLDNLGRTLLATQVLLRSYGQMLDWQARNTARIHKGMSLVKLSEAYRRLGWDCLAERYLLLTLVEDSISNHGEAKLSDGVYWRLTAAHGWGHAEINNWFSLAYEKKTIYEEWQWCPEAVLQNLPNDWMTSYPGSREGVQWQPNRFYCRLLLSRVGAAGKKDGLTLERLASYLLSCVPGARAERRVLTHSTDFDVFCTLEGEWHDFRQDLGRSWICECKDTDKVGFAMVAKFARVLDASRCKTGIIFTSGKISGAMKYRFAHREICRLQQQHGIVIIVLGIDCMERVGNGYPFLSLLKSKYEDVRHDLLWRKRDGQSAK